MKKQEAINELKKNPSKAEELLLGVSRISDLPVSELYTKILPSGFPSLDEYDFLKNSEGELIIIGARPSVGKSAFMFQLACNVAKTHPVHVFSLEMPKRTIVRRIVSGDMQRSIKDISKEGEVNEVEIEKSIQKLSSLQFYVDNAQDHNVTSLVNSAKDVFKKKGTRLIIVDYLQKLRRQRSYSSDAEIGEITRELQTLSRELSIPIVVGCQLNRGSVNRGLSNGSYFPNLSDLRDSGNIEQDADIVVLLHREECYKRDTDRKGEADFIIAKNRNGATGYVVMKYIDFQTKFVDLGQ